MENVTIDELYSSLEEDVIKELRRKHRVTFEAAKEVLQVNNFRERFMEDSEQFDFFEPEELAEEFHKAFEYLRTD